MYQIAETGKNFFLKILKMVLIIKRVMRTKIILKVRKISQFKIYKSIFSSLKKAMKKNIDVNVYKTLF